MSFIPVQQTTTIMSAAPPGTVPNFAGSPNQGAFIPVQSASAGVPGYQVEHRGVKGHHTVLHPIIYAQPPPQPQQPQVVVVQQPAPAPVQVPAPAPSPQQQPINIKINNSQPEQQAAPTTINNTATSPQPHIPQQQVQQQPQIQQQAQPQMQTTQQPQQITQQPQITQPTHTAPMVTQ